MILALGAEMRVSAGSRSAAQHTTVETRFDSALHDAKIAAKGDGKTSDAPVG